MLEKFCYQSAVVQDLAIFLKDKIVKWGADSVRLSFDGMFRFSSRGPLTAKLSRFVTKFSDSNDSYFYLDLNLTVFRYLFDSRLGFKQPIETAEEIPDELSELEIMSARPLLSEFSSISEILFPKKTDRGSFEPIRSGVNWDALEEKNDAGNEVHYLVRLEFGLSIGTYLSTLNIILPVNEEEYQKAAATICSGEKKDLSLVVKIGKMRIPIQDLKNLRKGDILWTAIPADVLYTVEINGVPAFHGQPGRYRDQMAIQLKGKGPAPFIPEK